MAADRLDAALRALCPELSRQRARSLCAIGAVTVDGVRADATLRVRPGDVVAWPAAHLEAMLQMRLAIAHDADGVLVLYKLPGLAVHAGPLVDDSVAARLAAALPAAGLAQRLDRPASGLLLCGRTSADRARLGAAMEQGGITREYLAVSAGVVAEDRRTIDLPLFATDEPMGDRPKVVVDDRGQRAVTHLEVVARRRDATLVRLRLETGRTHQIRAHLRAIGRPLLGDGRYGDAEANAAAHRTHGIDRALLHCERLIVPQRDGGPSTEIRAWHEPDFARLFPELRRR